MLHAILREPAVGRWWGSVDASETFNAPDTVALAIVSEEEAGKGRVVGLIQYAEVGDPRYYSAGLDLFLATGQQGRGLGTEALRALIRWLIDVRGHHRLTIDPALANAAAIHVYGKLGFRPVGVLRDYERDDDGVWRNGLLMELLARDLVAEDR